ncbi:response regulator [Atopomonas sediminilitoris]|uniref:response regulator n=1 Tax=Atopomonas sediminilitoris TaxID=2919919 RepID=UPI001F4EDEAB|nr:response regulator [Atopomonas sediminilitoris]MCJ8169482.1 response regulator [Atopomonas sediminilitoris]
MSKVTVLVVDDAAFIRDLVKKGLRSHLPGVQIEEAINGRKAQQILARVDIDLVLCDWEMPEMSGLELLTWVRSEPRTAKVPFVMVTSRGDKENVVQAIQAGVSDYIGKPFSNDQLITKVKKALNKAGKLQLLAQQASKPTAASAFGNDSLNALTGGKAPVVNTPPPVAAEAFAAKPAAKAASSASKAPPAGRGQGTLRLPNSSCDCVIKALSLKEAQLVVKVQEQLPQVLESAVLDLQQGADNEVARLNGYLHSVAAMENTPSSEWLVVVFRFVDKDPQKLDYLSRLIARGSVQKHYSPGA